MKCQSDIRTRPFLLLVLAVLPIVIFSQKTDPLKHIDSLITIEEFGTATELIFKIKTKSQDAPSFNLGKLVYPLGKIEYLEDNATAFQNSKSLLEDLLAATPDSVQYEALLGMGLLYVDQGQPQKANPYVHRANELSRKGLEVQRVMASEHHLSEIGLKMGNFNQLLERNERALKILKDNPGKEFSLAPRVYNYKASLMHFTSKPDSAEYYFEKALMLIPTLEKTPENQYYLPGTIHGNWFMVKSSLGQFDEAMNVTTKSIGYYNAFLKNTNNHPLTEKVHFNLSISYRNLGSLFNDIGDTEKAKQIAAIGYHHAKQHFLKNTIQYFSAILMMGEAHLYANELDDARKYLTEGENALKLVEGENTSFYANLYGALANLENKSKNYKKAIYYFENTILNYTKYNSELFDQNQIYAFINMAHAYAKDEQFNKALETIENTYSKTTSLYGSNSYLSNAILLSKIRILYDSDAYEHTIDLCNEWLKSLSLNGSNKKAGLWYFQADKAEVLLLLAKADFALSDKKNLNQLLHIKTLADDAISAFELKKSLVTSREGVTNLIETNQEIFNFSKKVYLTLFQETNEKKYLHEVIVLHESSVYNRIRARLNLRENTLETIPSEILNTEKEIKEKLNSFFENEQTDLMEIDSLGSALKQWNSFLDTLKFKHPQYYKMRYATTSISLENLKNDLPKDVTLIRYFFIDEALYAAVITSDSEKLIPLHFKTLDSLMSFSSYQDSLETISATSHLLYQMLWEPLSKEVPTKKVVIFPDRELFNISFELLTPKKLNSFKEFSKNSLLAKHQISYNYSLLLLNGNDKTLEFEKDMVAFAPEFHTQMKEEYALAITDSVALDRSYLTLLPQPFNFNLVKKFSKRFQGTAFLNEQASKQLFTQKAKEHKIIHIGTHAESNNVNPELSRLVFAKNLLDTTTINDNYLYSYEIYNQNLNSNLAILTACETGKPAYQPGEGMISLAHAFNYAGSKSILTSLWEIDEQSSTRILEYFYEYLEKGLSKDEALRNAKLDYLSTSEGRIVHPQYWAGLVLMGETSPIPLSSSNSTFWWILLVAVITIILSLIYFHGKRTKIK